MVSSWIEAINESKRRSFLTAALRHKARHGRIISNKLENLLTLSNKTLSNDKMPLALLFRCTVG